MNKVVLLSMVLMSSVCTFAGQGPTPCTGTVNVVDYGDLPKEDLGKVINRMFDKGIDNIYIPPMQGLYIATPICPPTEQAGVRVRIVSDAPRHPKYEILCITGNDRPAIDLQGCAFTEIRGLALKARNDPRGKASACAILMARPKDGACSGDHVIRDNIMEGGFAKCMVYNIGAEELVFENNWLTHYSVEGPTDERTACYVISNFEVFPEIKSRGPRGPHGVSNSTMSFKADSFRQLNKGASCIYVGQWSLDLNFDLNFAGLWSGGKGEPKAFMTVNQQVHNINLRIGRVECDSKKIRILYQTGDADCGAINILGGSFFRSGPASSQTGPMFELTGPATSKVALNISPECNFNMELPGAEEIDILKSTRKIVNSRIAIMNSSPNAKVRISELVHSTLTMPRQANFSGKTKGCTLNFYEDEKTIIQNRVLTTQPVKTTISNNK